MAVVLCAGQGTRMGMTGNKVFLPLGGRPLLVHALDVFARSKAIDDILLVAHPQEVDACRCEVVERYGLAKVSRVLPGGASRHQSEDCALAALRGDIEAGRVGVVLIHDGARPFITPDEVTRLAAAARTNDGGAMLATPVADDEVIIRLGPDGKITETYSSGELARAQTPQAFDARTLLRAYDAARADGYEGTDTAASVERLGRPVAIVACDSRNIKVTTPDDLLRAEALLRG